MNQQACLKMILKIYTLLLFLGSDEQESDITSMFFKLFLIYYYLLLFIHSHTFFSHQQTRSMVSSFSPRMRLFIVLQYLRQNPDPKSLKQTYGIDRSYLCRELRHLLPIIYICSNNIKLPAADEWKEHPFEQVSAVVDCSSHFRVRVHPCQAEWYRYDKHGFFFTAQVICDLRGVILSVQLGLGHNNDKGMFILTKMIPGMMHRKA